MKAYYILREDLKLSSSRIFSLAVKSTASINNKDWNKNPKSTTVMIFNLFHLYRLESEFIENGIRFEWIEDNNTLVGIVIYPTKEDIINEFLYDCMTLDEFAKNRQKEFDELAKI